MQTLKRIYGASFIFSLSLAFTAYVNSSFLSEHVGAELVGVLYAVAAFVTIVGLELMPKAIERRGNRTIIMLLVLANIASLGLLSMGLSPIQTAIAFILFNATNTLIWYCLDLFVEHFSANKKVGSIRGAYLSLTNLAWLFAPIIAGIIVTTSGYRSLYGIVMIMVVVVGVILKFTLQSYHDGKYRALSSISAVGTLLKRPDLLRITLVNFILQFFYAWMVIYTPLYLHEVQHISFEALGVMFTIMLLSFVIFQYPVGRLIDVFHHERQILQIGVLIMAAMTYLFANSVGGSSILVLGVILFGTRVGASIVEVVSESYFFKSVTDADAELISLFRSTSPIAFLIAPLLGTLVISLGGYQMLFPLLAAVVLLAILPLDRLSNIV
jgi:MFS family permease